MPVLSKMMKDVQNTHVFDYYGNVRPDLVAIPLGVLVAIIRKYGEVRVNEMDILKAEVGTYTLTVTREPAPNMPPFLKDDVVYRLVDNPPRRP